MDYNIVNLERGKVERRQETSYIPSTAAQMNLLLVTAAVL